MQQIHHQSPAALDLSDLTATNVLAFLDYLEQERHNKARTRNARLSALRAFAQYLLAFDAVAQTPPESVAQRKRFEIRTTSAAQSFWLSLVPLRGGSPNPSR